jgi:hypothetical protein
MYLIEGDNRTWSEEIVQQKAAELVSLMFLFLEQSLTRETSEHRARTTRQSYLNCLRQNSAALKPLRVPGRHVFGLLTLSRLVNSDSL